MVYNLAICCRNAKIFCFINMIVFTKLYNVCTQYNFIFKKSTIWSFGSLWKSHVNWNK